MTKQEIINELQNRIAEYNTLSDKEDVKAEESWDKGNKDLYDLHSRYSTQYLKIAGAYESALKLLENLED